MNTYHVPEGRNPYEVEMALVAPCCRDRAVGAEAR